MACKIPLSSPRKWRHQGIKLCSYYALHWLILYLTVFLVLSFEIYNLIFFLQNLFSGYTSEKYLYCVHLYEAHFIILDMVCAVHIEGIHTYTVYNINYIKCVPDILCLSVCQRNKNIAKISWVDYKCLILDWVKFKYLRWVGNFFCFPNAVRKK